MNEPFECAVCFEPIREGQQVVRGVGWNNSTGRHEYGLVHVECDGY